MFCREMLAKWELHPLDFCHGQFGSFPWLHQSQSQLRWPERVRAYFGKGVKPCSQIFSRMLQRFLVASHLLGDLCLEEITTDHGSARNLLLSIARAVNRRQTPDNCQAKPGLTVLSSTRTL